MKKKVIFMIINMNIGGTEKALLNMIAEIPKMKYDITILMLEKYGGFLDSIPNQIYVEYVHEYPELKELVNQPTPFIIANLLRKGKIVKGFSLFFIYVLAKVANNRSIFFKYILKDVPKLNNDYDIAVAYAGPMDFISYFVVKKINAKRKMQWIHFDVTRIGFNKRFVNKIYQSFEKIFVVSNEGKQKILQLFPKLTDKVEVFPNLISSKLIIDQSKSGVGFQDRFAGIRILTVGRLSKEKGQDLIISVMKYLKKNGFDIRWYCLGEGPARKEYESLIKDHGLEQDFILLGANPNPYPFMKQCDIYVQPSRHEGYCITLAEAIIFTNPIICTNFTGANEQLFNYKDGIIVNFDKAEMVAAIKKVIKEKKL